MGKYLFFNRKKGFFTNILIVIQVILWIYYSSTLAALIQFNSNFINYYKNNFPMEKGAFLTFPKSQLYGTKLDFEELIKSFEENNIKYGICFNKLNKIEEEAIPEEVLGVKAKEIAVKMSEEYNGEGYIENIKVNKGCIEYYKNKMISDDKIEDIWEIDEENKICPIVIGNNLSCSLKINDEFEYNGMKFIVKGILNKNSFIAPRYNTILGIKPLDDKVLTPISIDYIIKYFSYEPITVYGDKDIESTKNMVKSVLGENLEAVTVSDYAVKLETHLNDIRFKIAFEITKTLILTILTILSIVMTLVFKVKMSHDIIGTLYSIGISKKKVFCIFAREFLSFIVIAIGLGYVFYIKNSEYIFRVFYNKYKYSSLAVSTVVLIIILITSLKIIFNRINRLTPKEIMGGFTE